MFICTLQLSSRNFKTTPVQKEQWKIKIIYIFSSKFPFFFPHSYCTTFFRPLILFRFNTATLRDFWPWYSTYISLKYLSYFGYDIFWNLFAKYGQRTPPNVLKSFLSITRFTSLNSGDFICRIWWCSLTMFLREEDRE